MHLLTQDFMNNLQKMMVKEPHVWVGDQELLIRCKQPTLRNIGGWKKEVLSMKS